MQEMIETQQELNKDIHDIQKEQTLAMRDLFESTRHRNCDYLFVNIPVYDGAGKEELRVLARSDRNCLSNCWQRTRH